MGTDATTVTRILRLGLEETLTYAGTFNKTVVPSGTVVEKVTETIRIQSSNKSERCLSLQAQLTLQVTRTAKTLEDSQAVPEGTLAIPSS